MVKNKLHPKGVVKIHICTSVKRNSQKFFDTDAVRYSISFQTQ